MAATQGHTQSLHTNALDEALALPTPFSARIARNTPAFPAAGKRHDAHHRSLGRLLLCRAADRRTRGRAPRRISTRSRRSAAWPRRSRPASPNCASRKRRRAPRRASTPASRSVIGVNKFRPQVERPIDVLKVDNASVRAQQIEKLRASARRTRRGGDAGRAARADRGRARGRQSAGALRSRRRAPRRRSARFRWRWRRRSGAMSPRSARSPASTRREAGSGVERDRARAGDDPSLSPRTRAGGRAFSSPRSGRTAMIAARRSSPRLSPISASTSISGRYSRRPKKSRARPSRTTCISSAFPRSPPAI